MSKDAKNVPALRFKGYSDAWEKRKLREITEINPKGKIPEVFRYVDLESVKNSSIISSKIETKQTAPSRAQRTAEIGDVFYQTVRPYQKNNVIFLLHSSMPYVFSTGYAQLRSNMNSFFILYLVQTDGFVNDVLNRATGTSYPAINPTHLATIIVCFPKIVSEQNRIGQVLEHLDNLITATQHKIDALEQAKKALLQRLFDQSWRFKGYSDPWEKRKLGELAEFINGRAYKQDELLASGKYSVLRVGNFYTNDKWYYSNLELPEKYYAEEGDLLYTWSATFGPHIWIGPKVIYHYHIWKVALKNIFEKDFALQFFEADRVRLLNSTNGSTMIHVTKKDMESKGILLPDVYEQRTIGDLLKRVDHLIAATQSRLSSLELLKKALLQDLFI